MRYSPSSLSAVSYCNGYTRWYYRLDKDGVPPIKFFSPAWKMLRIGDQVDFISRTHAGTLVVSSSSERLVETLIAYIVPLLPEPSPC